MKDTTFELSAEHLLGLTSADFNVFWQAEMIRMSSEPMSPPPGPTKPMTPLTSQTSGSKKRQVFLSQHNDLLDEPVIESTKTLLDQQKVDSSHLNLLPILLEASKDLPEFIFTFMTIILHLITHLKIWINHVISVTPPALGESSRLSVQDDHLLQLDSTSLSAQDTSSVDIKFVQI